MPVVRAQVTAEVPPEVAFVVSQTTGALRLSWDPFIRRQHFLDGAERPAKGVRTLTRSRHGLRMVSEYVSYAPPSHVGMKMVSGPWFFEMFAGGWRFAPAPGGRGTVATWTYSFRCRPRLLRPVMNTVGTWLLGRDIRRRLAAFAAACDDERICAVAVGQGAA
ncbi:SRPBCC family protein [Frankia sp. CNm7]|uniref:SRPBCC family protein n=1 Tax=Frankia nepalensis TaxID=1836974 RepID=A0A937RA20_9ACTN|nr:SRPBCC family protein [Frankia nepalensis]MBL7500794.1 SRPBCC family protein [Frankia nepalensis]MBL7512601.1 SRPBCC family protein [Frankia nepalensis]MBL7523041.1 SRPBCC family protein [Frankia nepalensis]MBL7628206.1 SRPBCC family protein [Frankia nepalensis]